MDDHVRLCHCGLHKLYHGVGGVQWYWSRHTEMICYMTEPDGPCWCGNSKSMHWNGHAPSAAYHDSKEITERQFKWTKERLEKCAEHYATKSSQ